jgi:hypothetical protein
MPPDPKFAVLALALAAPALALTFVGIVFPMGNRARVVLAAVSSVLLVAAWVLILAT